MLADLYRRDSKWVLSVEERCKYLVLGKSRGSSAGLKAHVFCPMLKDKRDAIRVIADRWKLSINAAGWEPKRFIVVHVTPKSKAPPRILGVKGTTSLNAPHPPAFDPLVDMDPRLVVSFADLPRDADISALVLRFGGECELVWLNDKNALAVFHDPARAATAMRRLDHGSAYNGAVVVHPVGGGTTASTSAWGGVGTKGNPWKKAVVAQEDSWGGEEWATGVSADIQTSAWKKETPITASVNRWAILDRETPHNTSASLTSLGAVQSAKDVASSSQSSLESKTVAPTLTPATPSVGVSFSEMDASEVAEDWEEAYDTLP